MYEFMKGSLFITKGVAKGGVHRCDVTWRLDLNLTDEIHVK